MINRKSIKTFQILSIYYFEVMMNFVLSLHNLIRWAILIVIVGLMIKVIIDILGIKSKIKMNESQANNFLDSSKIILRKISLVLIILVNIQFLIGFILYFLNPSIVGLWTDFSMVMKQRELRMIVVEHPILMLIFVGLIHYLNVSVKKIENLNHYKKIIIISSISLIILILGIPWFRPLIRI